MATKKADEPKTDPVVTSASVEAAPDYPEGTHPARSSDEVTHSASRIKYRDNPDKPDRSSVAQLADIPDDFPGQ